MDLLSFYCSYLYHLCREYYIDKYVDIEYLTVTFIHKVPSYTSFILTVPIEFLP